MVELPYVLAKEIGARQRYVHHLVRAGGNAVSSLTAFHLVTLLFAEDYGSAPRCINMHPELMLLADVRDRVQGVEGAKHRSPCGRINVERRLACTDGGLDLEGFLVSLHPRRLRQSRTLSEVSAHSRTKVACTALTFCGARSASYTHVRRRGHF